MADCLSLSMSWYSLPLLKKGKLNYSLQATRLILNAHMKLHWRHYVLAQGHADWRHVPWGGNDYNLRAEPVVTVSKCTGLPDPVMEPEQGQEKAPLLAFRENLADPIDGWRLGKTWRSFIKGNYTILIPQCPLSLWGGQADHHLSLRFLCVLSETLVLL